MSLLVLLLISLSLAYLFSEICRRFNLPRVVGQIFAGMVLAFLAKDTLLVGQAADSFAQLANVGIILLFFFTGYEVNLGEFRRHFKSSISIFVFNTSIPFIFGFLLASYLGLGLVAAVIIGICLSVSSQAIALDFLEELNMLRTRIGNMIITAGAVDDLMELLFISVLVTFLQISIGTGSLLNVFFGMLVFIGLVAILRFFIAPFLLNVVQKEHSASGLLMVALILTLAMASITDYLGLGTLVGALLTGVIVRHSIIQEPHRKPWEAHEISQTIHTISFGFLVPIFFVWVGANTDIFSILANPFLSIMLTIIAIVGTVAGTAIAVRLNRGSWEEGMLVGWGVTSKGDVELVVASIALQNQLITKDIYSALIFMAFMTTLIAPVVFRKLIMANTQRSASVRIRIA